MRLLAADPPIHDDLVCVRDARCCDALTLLPSTASIVVAPKRGPSSGARGDTDVRLNFVDKLLRVLNFPRLLPSVVRFGVAVRLFHRVVYMCGVVVVWFVIDKRRAGR